MPSDKKKRKKKSNKLWMNQKKIPFPESKFSIEKIIKCLVVAVIANNKNIKTIVNI